MVPQNVPIPEGVDYTLLDISIQAVRVRLGEIQMQLLELDDKFNARHRRVLDALMALVDQVDLLGRHATTLRYLTNEVNNVAAMLESHRL